VAWFIGQSAIMIVLAFILGLLVGWLIWGRRLRALLIENKALRERVAECDADHLPRLKAAEEAAAAPVEAAPVEAAPAPVTAVHIPAPRAETTGVPASGRALNQPPRSWILAGNERTPRGAAGRGGEVRPCRPKPGEPAGSPSGHVRSRERSARLRIVARDLNGVS